jgi:curli biogenesis system outer membrane secretion channel CsgG
MKKFLPLFLAVINLISPLKAADQSVQSTINRMANELTATYRSKSPNAKRARLAILDLQASEDLNKQRISPALTDMITNEFVNKSDFIVLERELFGKIMEEHQLLANFGDVSNAIKVGKVLGAEVVLLGSVTQFKSDLRANLRLVNTETTEILSTSAGVISIGEFSKQNPQIAGYVPLTQKIGIFALLNHRLAGHSKAPITYVRVEGPDSFFYTLNLSDFDFDEVGAGIRYFPTSKFYFEGSLSQIQGVKLSDKSTSYSDQPPFFGVNQYSATPEVKGSSWRIGIGYRKRLMDKLTVDVDGGAISQKMTIDSGVFRVNSALSQIVPYLGTGINYDFQQRFSFSLKINLDLAPLEAKINETSQISYTVNPISISPQISFYF